MNQAYIIDAVRTPIGRYGGVLSNIRPDDLAAHLIKSILKRNPQIDVNLIEDVLLGCTNQAGEDNRNVARMALLLAGLPADIPGATTNRLCASGMQAVMDASRAIMTGDGDVFIAGGVESMSRAPFVMPKSEYAFDRNIKFYDSTIGWRFPNKRLNDLYYPYSMGETAENVADKWKISRQEQDEFAFSSQQKYKLAFSNNKFKDEILPVPFQMINGEINFVEIDEHPRPDTTKEKLAKLKPAFKQDGTVTAGNSSGINDGASVLLVVSEKTINSLNLNPIARVKAMAVAGVDPAYMGIGPVPATKKVFHRAGLKTNDVDLMELNEAFASQSIACIRELGIDANKVNVNGGAIALGHPLGCTGARIITTLLHEMKKRENVKTGLATMCVGVGQGASMIFEKV